MTKLNNTTEKVTLGLVIKNAFSLTKNAAGLASDVTRYGYAEALPFINNAVATAHENISGYRTNFSDHQHVALATGVAVTPAVEKKAVVTPVVSVPAVSGVTEARVLEIVRAENENLVNALMAMLEARDSNKAVA